MRRLALAGDDSTSFREWPGVADADGGDPCGPRRLRSMNLDIRHWLTPVHQRLHSTLGIDYNHLTCSDGQGGTRTLPADSGSRVVAATTSWISHRIRSG